MRAEREGVVEGEGGGRQKRLAVPLGDGVVIGGQKGYGPERAMLGQSTEDEREKREDLVEGAGGEEVLDNVVVQLARLHFIAGQHRG